VGEVVELSRAPVCHEVCAAGRTVAGTGQPTLHAVDMHDRAVGLLSEGQEDASVREAVAGHRAGKGREGLVVVAHG
jgi:hypothetical protein